MSDYTAVHLAPAVPATGIGSSRRHLTAVMMADMVGFSRMLEADEVSNSEHALRAIILFRKLTAAFGGQIANVAGDGVLAFFDSARSALQCALMIQLEFSEQAAWEGGEPIRFRVGINLGEVDRAREVIHAHCVNVAARVQTLAEPGRVAVTDAVRAAVRELPGVNFRSLGYPRLKNITETIEVFALEPSSTWRETRPVLNVAAFAAPSQDVGRNQLDQPTIAVLSFENMTGDPSSDYIANGLADAIVGDLSRFRTLTVIARHSSSVFALDRFNPAEIGQRLSSDYLLVGRLQRGGIRVRVAVELIVCATGTVAWSDRFEESLDRLFDVQDEITGAVAARLALQIDLVEQRRAVDRQFDMRAYGLLLRGQHVISTISRESVAYGRELFGEALQYHRSYARAFSASSRTHNLDWRYAWTADPRSSLQTAVSMALMAIERDPLDATAFAELGFATLYQREIDRSLAEYERAIALNPNDADVLTQYADAITYAGRPEDALPHLQRAMKRNPFYPDLYLWVLGDAYDALGRSEDVVATVSKMRDFNQARRLLASNLARLGRLEEAKAHAVEILRNTPGFTISLWRDRLPHRDIAVRERFLEGLRMAGLPS